MASPFMGIWQSLARSTSHGRPPQWSISLCCLGNLISSAIENKHSGFGQAVLVHASEPRRTAKGRVSPRSAGATQPVRGGGPHPTPLYHRGLRLGDVPWGRQAQRGKLEVRDTRR